MAISVHGQKRNFPLIPLNEMNGLNLRRAYILTFPIVTEISFLVSSKSEATMMAGALRLEATGQDHSGHSPMSTTNNIHTLGFDEGRIVTCWDCPYWRASSRYMAGNKQLPCDIPGLGVPMKNQPGPITGSFIHLCTLHLKKNGLLADTKICSEKSTTSIYFELTYIKRALF